MDCFDSTTILFGGHITVLVQKTGNVKEMLVLQGWFNYALARYGIDEVVVKSVRQMTSQEELFRYHFAVRSNR